MSTDLRGSPVEISGRTPGVGAGQVVGRQRRAEVVVGRRRAGSRRPPRAGGTWCVVERALVVVVGRAEQRAPEPRQREDRAPAAGRHDRAARRERQVLVAQRDVRAAAGADARDLGLVVQLVGAQAVGPDAGRVDDVRRRARRTRSPPAVLAHAHARRAAGLVAHELGHLDAVGADRAEALGLGEDGQHEPRVVGLAVVEEVAGRRRARRRARARARATSSPVIMRWRSGLHSDGSARRRRRRRAPRSARARRAAQALDGHDVVEVQADAGAAGPGARRRRRRRRAAAGGRGAARARPSAGARAAPRARGRGRSSAGSAGRRGRAWTSGSTCPPRSPRARRARRCSRAWRRRSATPAPVMPPPTTTTSNVSEASASSASARAIIDASLPARSSDRRPCRSTTHARRLARAASAAPARPSAR